MCVTFHFSQGEDAGNYMCVATNDAGVVERSVTLTLQSKSLSLCVNSLLYETTSTVTEPLEQYRIKI